jgi:hypothetical protein
MQKNLLLLIPIVIVIVILLSTKKKDSKVCPPCQECKTCVECAPCPGNVNLDKLLYNLPSGTERYKLLSTGKSLTNTDDPCPISDSTDLSRNINIETIQSGLLELNQDTATKDKYKYVWRPYNN